MVEFTLPVPEKFSTNKAYSGIHWAVRKKLKDLYHQSILPYKGKHYLGSYPVVITYSFVWVKHPLDTTNETYMVKMLEDGMVHAGILPDDDPKHVAETRIRSRKGDGDYVTISIEPDYLPA